MNSSDANINDMDMVTKNQHETIEITRISSDICVLSSLPFCLNCVPVSEEEIYGNICGNYIKIF